MTKGIDPRLERLLGGERLARLRQRLRRRFELEDLERPLGRIVVGDLEPDEHAALAALIGRPARVSKSITLDLPAVDAALGAAGVADSLRGALERLDGAIVHAASARADDARRWAGVVARRQGSLGQWLHSPANLGLLKRLARDTAAAASLCEGAEAVLRRLPARGITRAQLAAEVLGDAHALDASRPAATLVSSVLRDAARQGGSVLEDVERARSVWASAGVLVNELARPALFLNLPFDADRDHASIPGEPGFSSLRWLVRTKPTWRVAGRTVFVCENPNVVAIAADQLGHRCHPLVCIEGAPGAAQRTLLWQLSAAGARLRYHGDFDWPGVRIANVMVREHGAVPWRLGAADYRAAVDAAAAAASLGRLCGEPCRALWDDELEVAMRSHGIAVAEEAVMGVLLHDLESMPPASS